MKITVIRRRVVIRLVVVGFAASGSVTSCRADAAADLSGIDAKLQSCLKSDDSNTNMKSCTVSAQASAENVLTSIYKTVISQSRSSNPDSQSKEALQRIVASERAWITYRDAECRMEGSTMLGGSGEGLVVGSCLFRLTQERAKTLLTFLRDSGG